MSKKNNLDFVYKEEILERSLNPGFSSKLSKADKLVSGLNPFCGDEVKFHFNLNQDNITNIYLELEGCAIHKASSSFLAEILLNENINIIPSICDEFITFFNGKSNSNHKFKNQKLHITSPIHSVKSNQIRIKCVLLSWNAIYNNLFKN
jgi:nitrogen fixation NifU-like protein|tara:strand:+ start:257 stop:703 length:447 start_codon:yes stop_codon:yes gene_type:complete